MSYRQSLLLRWGRRDRLAVLVVAVAVAFLVGTTLLVFAAGAQTASIAASYDSPGRATHHDSLADARASAGPDDLVLPVADVEVNGSRARVVGVPAGTNRSFGPSHLRAPPSDADATLGGLSGSRAVRIAGDDGTVSATVTGRPQAGSLVPPDWYVSGTATVERVGATDALVVRESEDAGVPLLAALTFFLAGTREAVRTLAVAGGAAGLLVAVTVYAVTRMTVRDRLGAVRVVRATGGTRTTVLGLFALRAGLLAGAGIAVGYGIGVVATSAAANAAVVAGLPVSLSLRVTPAVVGVLLPGALALLAAGAVAGGLAALPAVRVPPGRLRAATDRRSALPTLGPRLLGWRPLVPTTATLAAFTVFVVLVAALAGVVAPATTTDAATVTEAGARSPASSSIPGSYADALRERGVTASPEILLFEVRDDQPFAARGANWSAFASLTGARLVDGRAPAPTATGEALVGRDLARTLDVAVGDRLALGGSTRPGLTRVQVVGVFASSGPADDQVLVSLPTARHLDGLAPGQVQQVRAERIPEGFAPRSAARVADVSVPTPVASNRTLTARVTLTNPGSESAESDHRLRFRGETVPVSATVPPGRSRTVAVEVPAGTPGTGTLRIGNVSRFVRVVPAGAVTLRGVPERAPPDSEPWVRAVGVGGQPAPDVAVTVGGRTVRTGPNGTVRLPLGGTGTYAVRPAPAGSPAERVSVTPTATRSLQGGLTVDPAAPSVLVQPTARLRLTNPWNRTLRRTVRVTGPGVNRTQGVAVGSGETRTLAVALPRRQPGTYTVRATTDGSFEAAATYRVTGDARLAAALASSGERGESGLQQGITTAFGNLQLVLATLLGLAGLMTVGGTTATFAGAVNARRQAVGVHRAAGAGPLAVLRLVLGDALRVGVVATALALLVGTLALRALAAAGYLTLFGVRLSPTPPLPVLGGVVAGALGLTLLGALLATAALLAVPPAALLRGGRDG